MYTVGSVWSVDSSLVYSCAFNVKEKLRFLRSKSTPAPPLIMIKTPESWMWLCYRLSVHKVPAGSWRFASLHIEHFVHFAKFKEQQKKKRTVTNFRCLVAAGRQLPLPVARKIGTVFQLRKMHNLAKKNKKRIDHKRCMVETRLFKIHAVTMVNNLKSLRKRTRRHSVKIVATFCRGATCVRLKQRNASENACIDSRKPVKLQLCGGQAHE